MPLEIAAEFEPLRPWFERHRRDAWSARVTDGDGDPKGSKFSGAAWLADGEAWPVCPLCGKPMALFLQLDLATAPRVHPQLTAGLLQAFFCVDLEACVYGPWCGDAFAPNHLLRVIDPQTPGRPATAPADSEAATALAPRMIVGWDRFDDYPSLTDAETRLGLRHGELTDEGDAVLCDDPPVEIDADIDAFEALPQARAGEKLGGWPAWANIYTDYRPCPECGREMDWQLFQFGGDGLVPVMFGDGGVGHLVCCRDHPHVMAYPWSCG
jgi:hypothetical protein